jgi:hypothetical protein
LLRTMKANLPFLLRYEGGRSGHRDHNDSTIRVPQTGMPAEGLLRLIAQNVGLASHKISEPSYPLQGTPPLRARDRDLAYLVRWVLFLGTHR